MSEFAPNRNGSGGSSENSSWDTLANDMKSAGGVESDGSGGESLTWIREELCGALKESETRVGVIGGLKKMIDRFIDSYYDVENNRWVRLAIGFLELSLTLSCVMLSTVAMRQYQRVFNVLRRQWADEGARREYASGPEDKVVLACNDGSEDAELMWELQGQNKKLARAYLIERVGVAESELGRKDRTPGENEAIAYQIYEYYCQDSEIIYDLKGISEKRSRYPSSDYGKIYQVQNEENAVYKKEEPEVCYGMALGLTRLFSEVGIDAKMFLYSGPKVGHAITLATFDGEIYYEFDPTWGEYNSDWYCLGYSSHEDETTVWERVQSHPFEWQDRSGETYLCMSLDYAPFDIRIATEEPSVRDIYSPEEIHRMVEVGSLTTDSLDRVFGGDIGDCRLSNFKRFQERGFFGVLLPNGEVASSGGDGLEAGADSPTGGATRDEHKVEG